METLKEDLKVRQKLEAKKLEMKREEIKIQRERVMADNDSYQNIIQTTNRRLEIEQKHLEIDAK